MIVFTEPGDTPESVAHRHLGYNDASKAKKIREANRNSFAWEIMNRSGFYAANRALWFPVEGEDTLPDIQSLITHEFDWLTGDQRAMLAQAQKADINIHDVLHAHQLNTFANTAMGASLTAIDGLHSGIEIRHERMKDFQELIQQAKEKLGKMADSATSEERLMSRQEFGRVYKDIITKYNRYFKQMGGDAQYQLKKPWKTIRTMKKQGWAIDDLIDAKRIAGVASKLRFAVGAGYIFMLVEGGINVAETWHHTHNWSATLKEADIEIVDIATGVLTTAVAGLVLVAVGFTAPEWITCLIVGSAGMALGELFSKELINPFIDKEWKTGV